MRDLPLDREKALAAIAAGWGREATLAHPMCMCSRLVRPACVFCEAGRDESCTPTTRQEREQHRRGTFGEHRGRHPIRLSTQNCPMHKPMHK